MDSSSPDEDGPRRPAGWVERVRALVGAVCPPGLDPEGVVTGVLERVEDDADDRTLRRAAMEEVSIALSVRGDLDGLVRLWAPVVLRWCRSVCDGRVQPDDAAQDVLLRLARKPPVIERAQALRPWLWGVTWRTVRGHERVAWVRRWLPGDGRDPEPRGGVDPADETAGAVKEVLLALQPQHRQLLWLAYVEGASRAEIGEHLGIALGTLNRRLTEARTAFEAAAREGGLDVGREAS